MARKDPRIAEVVNTLPADGSAISHAAWREQLISSRQQALLPFTQKARRSGDVVFEIGNPEDPTGSLTVRRALIVAPAAAPAGASRAPVAAPVKAPDNG